MSAANTKRPKAVETPLMKQYYQIKSKHPDAILLFRVGDFYETFSDDAIKTSNILGIALAKRANGAASYVELAGFPYHALDNYLPKLVKAGQRVAICEQLEDPKTTKKIVKRGVTELVTPGVSLNDAILENRENNFLASVHFSKKISGIAFLDISTGEFLTAEGSFEYIDRLINNFNPKEILVERKKEKLFIESFGTKFYTYQLDDWVFSEESSQEKLLKHFETSSLKGFGVEELKIGTIAAGAILQYLDLTQHHKLDHIIHLSRIEEDKYVWLDKFTVRNLELFTSLHENAKTLMDIIDRTISPMGSRLLKRWIALPLKEIQPINERLNVVNYFIDKDTVKVKIEEKLKQIGDLERLTSKISIGRISPKEVVILKRALVSISTIKQLCLEASNRNIQNIGEQLNICKPVIDRIEKEIVESPPTSLNKGNVISNNVSEELDQLRKIAFSGKDFLIQLQQKEKERTAISSLKIGFNNVFGYYFEVRNIYKNKVPQDWMRKQTLVSAERYISSELKEYEEKILGAEEKIQLLESQIFNDLVLSISEFIQAIQLNASLIARLDCLLSFAKIAVENNYTQPILTDENTIDIKEGRHPVIEKQLGIGENYIANNLFLSPDEQQVIIITGPNMSGKSALLRQTALIVLLAQIGSFVPAQSATIGMVDKIFTRVGASDNISLGESTFMVEMNEAASILNNISNKSLILFDELGRGTSTYDGISIAWSIVEYIHEHATRAKTLFATHYHELNEMEKSFARVENYNVTVKEIGNKILFLRKLVRGGSNHSFGIQVAKMAGMPKIVVNRAIKILKQLEGKQQDANLSKPINNIVQSREGYQLSFYQLDDPLLAKIKEQIENIDIENLTPIEALNKLNEIKKISGM